MLALARLRPHNAAWIEHLAALQLPSTLSCSSREVSSTPEGASAARPSPGSAPGSPPAPPSAAPTPQADPTSTASRARAAADALRSTLKSVSDRAKSANELLHALRSLEPLAPTEGAGRVAALHAQSLLQNYGRLLGLAALSGVTYTLWGALSEMAQLLGAPTSTTASYLALAGALASTGGGLAYVRSLYSLHPSAAYRAALLQLNTSPAVLEVMGAPLAGLGPRVAIVSSGGLAWGSGWPRPRAARVLLAFPLRGSECRGLALVEAKRLLGKVVVKALAVDVPGPGGREERIYVLGDGAEHSRNVIFNEMRDPLIKVVALREEYAREDDLDASRARAAAERARLAASRLRAERRAAAAASAEAHREAAARVKAEAAAAGGPAAESAAPGSAPGQAATGTKSSDGDAAAAAGSTASAGASGAHGDGAAASASGAAAAQQGGPTSSTGHTATAAGNGADLAAAADSKEGAESGPQQKTRPWWWPWMQPAAPPDAPADAQPPKKQ